MKIEKLRSIGAFLNNSAASAFLDKYETEKPVDCVQTFFAKMATNDREYCKTFMKELRKLRKFVHDWARKKNEELVEKEKGEKHSNDSNSDVVEMITSTPKVNIQQIDEEAIKIPDDRVEHLEK